MEARYAGNQNVRQAFFSKKMRPVKTHAYPRGPLVNRAGLIGC
jgi:hypothetical protein